MIRKQSVNDLLVSASVARTRRLQPESIHATYRIGYNYLHSRHESSYLETNYLPIFRHKIEFKLNQIKDHLMNTVEATCRGDPGAVYLTSTVRQASFATQGKNFITKASILESLHTFENEKRHIHRVFWTDR